MHMRCGLVAIVVVLIFPAGAWALPQDPPFGPVAPADGAALPVNPDGIGVSFTCPVYKIDDPGFPIFGGPKDYGVTLATSPELGADGRLVPGTLSQGVSDPAVGPDGCSAALGAGGAPPRVQETPGTYYWQVWRLCTGCPGSYEVGPVRTLELRSEVKPALSITGRAYAGHPFLVSLALAGAPDGSEAVVERQVGGSWRRAGAGTSLGGKAEAVVTLPAGKQRLRTSIRIGSQAIAGEARDVSVRKARKWSTGSTADGRYKGRVGSRSVRFTVARKGRELRAYTAFVPMLCPGVVAGQFTTQIGTATLRRAKIAPDGSFVAASTPEPGTTLRVRGRLRGRKVTGGRVELSVGNCVGNSAFGASRAGR
jgi:hypothetical protein